MDQPEIPILSVTQFNQMVSDVISQIRVWVQGEVSGFKISQNKWVSFDIKDARSRVNCFMTTYQLDQVLEDGMEIKVFGSPKIYVPYGKYSFNVQRVEPVGEGALRRAFELTKAKLEQEGIFDSIHKKEIPHFPENIGIVTSEDAAAYTDFLRILNNRWAGVKTILRPCLVQGDNAPAQIVAAIEWFNKFQPVDVMIVTRGGGSLEDLQAFNSEQVCRAIFASRIPIVCAVGHERDVSLAELVADLRASTPSNAAEMAVPDKQDILWQIDRLSKEMQALVSDKVQTLQMDIDGFINRLDHILGDQISTFKQLEHSLLLSFQTYVSKLQSFEQQVLSIKQRLVYAGAGVLQKYKLQISQIDKLLASFNPKSVLKRGYSITRLANGQVFKSIKQVKKGQVIQTELKDGVLASEVVEKKKEVSVNKRLI